MDGFRKHEVLRQPLYGNVVTPRTLSPLVFRSWLMIVKLYLKTRWGVWGQGRGLNFCERFHSKADKKMGGLITAGLFEIEANTGLVE